jgi:hypothetical protein
MSRCHRHLQKCYALSMVAWTGCQKLLEDDYSLNPLVEMVDAYMVQKLAVVEEAKEEVAN